MVRKKTAITSGTRSPKKQSAGISEAQAAAGGELHQVAGGEHAELTTNQGVALSDNQNSLKANPRGPVTETWYHRMGCRRFFTVRRDTEHGPRLSRSSIARRGPRKASWRRRPRMSCV